MTPPSDRLPSAAPAVVVPLDWDSRHFGVSVGRLEGAVDDDALLIGLLSEARAGGFEVVYWFAEEGREIPARLLAEFGGSVVCRRVTYLRELASGPAASSVTARHSSESSVPIVAHERSPADLRRVTSGA